MKDFGTERLILNVISEHTKVKLKDLKMKNSKNKRSLRGYMFLLPILVSGLYAFLQLTRNSYIEFNLSFTYLSLLAFPVSVFFWLYVTFENRLTRRRMVEDAEIKWLYSEVDRFPNGEKVILKSVRNEISRLKEGNREILELDLLPLRQNLVGLYPDEELVSQVQYELTLLQDYEEDDPDLYEDWEKRISEAVKRIEESRKEEESFKQIRSYIIKLREHVAQYDRAWAEGEVIFRRGLYWILVSTFMSILIGLLPLTHPLGDNGLGILHWGALGLSGGLLSILVGIQDPNIPELGETKGKIVVHQTILAAVVGGMTAMLLQAALNGRILAGKIFPEIPIDPSSDDFFIQTSGSIFWAIMAGFSLRILIGLARVAEGPFAKEDSE